LLRLWGHDVQEVDNGPDAIALARAWSPDVVVLDIGLPGVSGYEVARQVRLLPDGDRVVILAISGHARVEDIDRALDAGCDGHLGKPFDPNRLAGLIEAHGDQRVRLVRRARVG